MMPDVDGWEVYRQIKAKAGLKDVPVIIVTAKAQGIDRVLGLHIAGVDDYIAKPFGPKELADSVERILGSAEERQDARTAPDLGATEVRGDEA
jgi:DNA-binding response OmpR family regulator